MLFLLLSVGLIPLYTVRSALDIDPALEKSLLWLVLVGASYCLWCDTTIMCIETY
jgi:hypothetical protein